jgi:hypothetical protein
MDIYKCPKTIFPKYFPKKKQDILNNKCLDLLKEENKGKTKEASVCSRFHIIRRIHSMILAR